MKKLLGSILLIVLCMYVTSCDYNIQDIEDAVEDYRDNNKPPDPIITDPVGTYKLKGYFYGASDITGHIGEYYFISPAKLTSNIASVYVGDEAYYYDRVYTNGGEVWFGPPSVGVITVIAKDGNMYVSSAVPVVDDTTPTGVTYSNHYDHWNPDAWKGNGSAMVLCADSPKMDACEVEGSSLSPHGSKDKGRYVWTKYQTGLGGTVTCKDGSTYRSFKVSKTSMDHGSCSSPDVTYSNNDTSNIIEQCSFFGNTNNGRATWYCTKNMKNYPSTFYMDISGNCLSNFKVTNDGTRYDKDYRWIIKQSEVSGRGMGIIAIDSKCQNQTVTIKRKAE